jgi:hypothetical protein
MTSMTARSDKRPGINLRATALGLAIAAVLWAIGLAVWWLI